MLGRLGGRGGGSLPAIEFAFQPPRRKGYEGGICREAVAVGILCPILIYGRSSRR